MFSVDDFARDCARLRERVGDRLGWEFLKGRAGAFKHVGGIAMLQLGDHMFAVIDGELRVAHYRGGRSETGVVLEDGSIRPTLGHATYALATFRAILGGVKIVMTLLVRDEEDVLDVNLRYHLEQGVDHFVVTDNLSTDSTPEILAAHAESGVATVIQESEDVYAQGRWVTRMARIAAEDHGADWILHADADEFLLSPGRSVRNALAAIPERYGIVYMPRLNFRPRPDDGRPFFERLVYHETRPVNAQGRPLPPKVGHRGTPDAVVTQGNHDVRGTGLRRLRRSPIVIFHYPLRSYGQFERKVTLGGAAIERNKELHPNDGRRWVVLRERWLAGELPAWYDGQVLHDEEIEAALRAGDIRRDTRLADRLAGRGDYASEAVGAEAGGLAARLAGLRAKLPR